MEHRPWVQPRVPTGPIVLPNSASIGPQYAGVMLPQPLLPFANEYISYPQMPENGAANTPYTDWTGKLAPPIFLEQEASLSPSTTSSSLNEAFNEESSEVYLDAEMDDLHNEMESDMD